VAERFGVTLGDGGSVTDSNVLYDVLGPKNIAPMAMASAYATIANNGVRCTPHAIDRITDIDGNEVPVPETGCEKVVEPNIAATAAEALKSVVNGGTGAQANPGDGTPMIGKTGTHEGLQTSMIESSTKVTTGVWVGNVQGTADMYHTYPNGIRAADIRYTLARDIQAAANANYPGGEFAAADPNLTRRILKDLPDVTGMTIDEATNTLVGAGFQVSVGDTVPGSQPEGRIQRQDPGAGQAAGGSVVTIFPSNGDGAEVPDVAGMSLKAAFSAITGAGFSNVETGSCSENGDAGKGRATSTNPGAGEVADQGTTVIVDYEAAKCGGD
jgi:membrane peptidoglycan carboxypeptidase